MTIETATFLAALDSTKPLNTDLVSEGDDHLRLLKAVLQATFPGRGVGEKAPLSRIAPFAPGLSEISALFVANGATQADLPAVSGLPGGTHYWFWAADNDLLLTTLDTALINGGATLTLEQGTGACVFCTGSGWAAIGLGGGSGIQPLNLTADSPLAVDGTYPDLNLTYAADPLTEAFFRASHTGAAVLLSTTDDYLIDWNYTHFDTADGFVANSTEYAIPFDGYYSITLVVAFSVITGGIFSATLTAGGSSELKTAILTFNGSLPIQFITITGIFYLYEGEVIQGYGSNATTGNYIVESASLLSGHLISARAP